MWIELERQTLTGSVASVTLGNGGTINQGYKTLKLLISARTARTSGINDGALITFNGSGGTAYTTRIVEGNGGSAYSLTSANQSSLTLQQVATDNCTANTFGSLEFTVPNYAGATAKATSTDYVTENNATTSLQGLTAGLWTGTAAITSLTVTGQVNSFVSGSTFTLYGEK